MKINFFPKLISTILGFLVLIAMAFLSFKLGYYIFQLDLPTVMNFYVVHIAFGFLSGAIVFFILAAVIFIQLEKFYKSL